MSLQLGLGFASAIGVALLATAFRAPSPAPKVTPVAAKITYAEHVAPLLNARCVQCHRPNEVAPFSLVGYQNSKKWADMISTVAEKRQMPPWKAVHGYGEFAGENRLTDQEIMMLKTWASSGAPRGDARKEPKPPTFSSEWVLGKPDREISSEKPFQLEAEGEDVYRNFVVSLNNDKPVWVKAMDVRPGNKKIVHHVIAFLDSTKQARKLAAATKDGQPGYISSGGGVGFLPGGSLGGWAPGIRPIPTAEGTAFKVEPGSDIVIQVHYHKSGKPETDLTKVALYEAKEPIEQEVRLAWIFNFMLNIPPGNAAHPVKQVMNVPVDMTLRTVMPHMHLLGKSMKARVEFPDGTVKPLVFIDDWDFNWQLSYPLKEPMRIPKGSKIITEAVYDNSATNPRNPNSPPKRVTFGEQTTDEMFLLIASYTVDAERLSKQKTDSKR